MSFDRTGLIEACTAHGRVARVVVAQVRGSAPREVGASMLVWDDGFSGTIGGGALEYSASATARGALAVLGQRLTRHALGPDLGQCCGGSVDLFTEVFDLETAQALPEDIICRGQGQMPLAVARIQAGAEKDDVFPPPRLISGWMVEPVARAKRPVWIWGAGHVGRALVDVLAPLPEMDLTWVDTDTARFPRTVPTHVNPIAAAQPEKLVPYAPLHAEHLIVTYSHDLDLELCHQLLTHGFSFAGLIGSATKWARFKSRLGALGHSHDTVLRITCPIGDPLLGKEPHRIAIGVAHDLIATPRAAQKLEGTA